MDKTPFWEADILSASLAFYGTRRHNSPPLDPIQNRKIQSITSYPAIILMTNIIKDLI
jgi:hypothetical protein